MSEHDWCGTPEQEIESLRQLLEKAEARVEWMRQAGNRVISYGQPHIEWLTAIDHAVDPGPWLLRKQAEAVEAVAEKFLFKDRRVLTIEAQRLRNKADKLESNQ